MKAVIIVAGGKGLRMGGDVPKQFVEIGGRPVLMRTVERFLEYDPTMQVVLVLPASQQEYWRGLCVRHGFTAEVDIATGGETRFHSVRNGLELVRPEVTLVGVHDGVRPFASTDTISRCYAAASEHGAAVPVVPVVETIRHVEPGVKPGGETAGNGGEQPSGETAGNGGSTTVPRGEYRLVQTPQVFSAELLRMAYGQPYTDAFTDDASVVEAMGHGIALVDGNRENIKLTTPFDLTVAEAIMARPGGETAGNGNKRQEQ